MNPKELRKLSRIPIEDKKDFLDNQKSEQSLSNFLNGLLVLGLISFMLVLTTKSEYLYAASYSLLTVGLATKCIVSVAKRIN